MFVPVCGGVMVRMVNQSLCRTPSSPSALLLYPLVLLSQRHTHTLTQNLPQTLPTAGLHHNKFRLERHMPLVESTIIRPPMLGPMGVVAAKEFLHLLLLRLGNWPLFSFPYRTSKWYSVSRAEDSFGFGRFWVGSITRLKTQQHLNQHETLLNPVWCYEVTTIDTYIIDWVVPIDRLVLRSGSSAVRQGFWMLSDVYILLSAVLIKAFLVILLSFRMLIRLELFFIFHLLSSEDR